MITPTKLLRVSTDYFVAGALWTKIYGVWSCTSSAHILHWMIGMSPATAKIALLKMGADFLWVTPHDKRMGVSRQFPTAATHQSGGTNPGNRVTNPPDPNCTAENDTGALRGLPIATDGGSTHSTGGALARHASHEAPASPAIASPVPTAGSAPCPLTYA